MESSSGTVTVLQPVEDLIVGGNVIQGGLDVEQYQARKLFREFFRNFNIGNIFIYREALTRQWNCGDYFVEVELFHVQEFNRQLYNTLQVFGSILFIYVI